MLNLKEGIALERLELDGPAEGILVDTNTGRYYGLNSSAFAILTALTQFEEEQQAIAQILERLDVDPYTLNADVQAFKHELAEMDLTAP